jgi:putative peptide zinc metalloprotease protein
MRRFLVIAAVALSVFVTAGAGAAASGDSVVVAVNDRDGSFVYRVRLDIRRVTGSEVDATNAAVAVASCDTCETVAVAIQALLVLSDPTVVAPENIALAMNVDCTFCQTLASAYQFYIQAGTPVHFTAAGNAEIAQIRRQLQAVRHVGLTIAEIYAEVDRLANELLAVLQTEVVPAGRHGRA